jgi:hypothetical protein
MKINITKTEELNAAIDTIAGKARQHIHTGPQVQRDAEALYYQLTRHLSKKLLVGSKIKLSSRPVLPKAYGNRRVIHTEIEVEICPSGLFVTNIEKCGAWATNTLGYSARAILPEAVKTHLKSVLYAKAITK